MRFGLVAGEASGDTLGAALIESLRAIDPGASFVGVAGPKMRAAGCESWYPAEALAVMGLAEVIPHLPRLLRISRDIERRFCAVRPDVFVGVDAKEFNLRLARRLRGAGLLTVQYVSPQIWAWRPGRVRGMHAAVDLMLCLLPFEKPFYDAAGVRAEFIGHPLADAIALEPDRAAARAALAVPADAQVIALLPGSRRGEVARLGPDFAACAAWLAARRPGLQFIAPMASEVARDLFRDSLARNARDVAVTLLDGLAQPALIACDAALVASGTATLETALCKRPMVVAYRMGALTAWLIKSFGLVKSPFFAQPNLLAGKKLVGEYFQNDISPAKMGEELLAWLDDSAARERLAEEFRHIHLSLRRDASARAAEVITDLVAARARQ